MKSVPLAVAKNSLSRYVDEARRGARIRISVRGMPAAEIGPVTRQEEGDDDWGIAELVRQGLVRPGRAPRGPDRLDRAGPRVRGDAVASLIAERRAGR